MRKIKRKSLQELIQENKAEILNSRQAIHDIEERLENRLEKRIIAQGE